MRAIHLTAVLLALAALTLLMPSAARANIEYPWCAVYSGSMGGASNCGFSTIEQCRATVSGIGGSCEPTQFYHPSQNAVPKRKRERR